MSDTADIPSSDWTITNEGDVLIVDCSACGEIGTTPAAWATTSKASEYDRCAELFRSHVCAPDGAR